ncbi:uncharacterized protein isoform X1 [Choristoneura fumiferana]|uniref:uncharacterized protein isoform X1 n=1 Tax=Choristoneura fumiferana TaxID=7141 RepID=UPI003D15845A
MAIIESCCCWRSLRRGCYASAFYTIVYFSLTIVTLGHFVDVEHRYLSGEMEDPVSESFLEPEKITPITVSLNITLLACSSMGLVSCGMLILGVYKDMKYLLLPWIVSMVLITLVEIINLVYLFYLQTEGGECKNTTVDGARAPSKCAEQTINFNPVTSFLFTLDFFLIMLNIYAIVCVISQFQEYCDGRGTASFDFNDRDLAAVQYTAAAQHTATTTSGGRRRSAGRPMPSRCDPDEFSEAPKSIARSTGRPMPSRHDPEEFSEAPTKAITSVLSKPSRSTVKKHVQFPDEQSCIEEAPELAAELTEEAEKPESRVISSLWMELESDAPAPER